MYTVYPKIYISRKRCFRTVQRTYPLLPLTSIWIIRSPTIHLMVLVSVCVLPSWVWSQTGRNAILGLCNSSSDLTFQGPFEPDETEQFDASLPDHPGMRSSLQRSSGLLSHPIPNLASRECGLEVGHRDQDPQCTRSTICTKWLSTDMSLLVPGPPSPHFKGCSVQYINPSPASSKQKTQFGHDMQHGFSDNHPLPKGNGGIRGGTTHESDGIRLRQVSELRSYSLLFPDRHKSLKFLP